MKDINFTTSVQETGEMKRYTTLAVGEEGGRDKPIQWSTFAVGEEGDNRDNPTRFTIFARELGETTFAVGEEGDDNIRDIPPINNDYHMLLVLIKQLLDKIRRNIGIGVGINPSPIAQDPIIIDPPPVKGRPVPGQNYTDSMPRSMSANNSTRIEHAYLPEAE
ncbi:MAG: hypothetical protein N2485_04035 [bacterium]|nr:hypothetical protein [bacterium]